MESSQPRRKHHILQFRTSSQPCRHKKDEGQLYDFCGLKAEISENQRQICAGILFSHKSHRKKKEKAGDSVQPGKPLQKRKNFFAADRARRLYSR